VPLDVEAEDIASVLAGFLCVGGELYATIRSAAATASSTVVTASPGETGMSKEAKNCLP